MSGRAARGVAGGVRHDDAEAIDRARVRAAARAVAIWIAGATAAVTAVGAAAIATIVALQARHEGAEHEHGGAGVITPKPDAEWVIERDTVIWLVVIGAILAITVLTVVGWIAARRAVRPLADALRLQRRFVADASHELRTPLAVLSARAQLVERRLARGEPVDEPLAELRRDTAAMAEVLDDLLLAAESAAVDGGERTDVAAAAARATGNVQVIAADAGVRIALDVRATPAVRMPETGLVRCLVALLDNAVAHSPAGGEVDVEVDVERTAAVLRVRDRGAGIQGLEPDAVFDRFAHGPERGRRRGFGIGLALVRDLAQRYGGDVAVESTSADGTVMRLRLPVED